jgi:Calcium binding
MNSRDLVIGESVVVKPGITDPDTGDDISGWQGRISAVENDGSRILAIEWDSLTLKNMSPEHIAWCEEEGLSWTDMYLSFDDVEPATARDSKDDVAKTVAELERRYGWLFLGGEQGKRIQAIVNSAQGDDDFAVMQSWHAYLEKHLVFPFTATVEEYQRGPVREGARVTVLSITSLADPYGTIVAVKHKDGIYELPLCDLKATKANAETRQLVEDYAEWFANR